MQLLELHALVIAHDGFDQSAPTRQMVVASACPVAWYLSGGVSTRRRYGGRYFGGLCDPGLARLCVARRSAAAGRHLRLPAGRARLPAARLPSARRAP